jgi:hypothetical protein
MKRVLSSLAATLTYVFPCELQRFCRRVYELANMPRGNVIVHYRLSQAPDSGHQGSATDRAVSSWLQADRDRGSVLAGCNKASGGFASGGACDSDYGSAEAMDEALVSLDSPRLLQKFFLV